MTPQETLIAWTPAALLTPRALFYYVCCRVLPVPATFVQGAMLLLEPLLLFGPPLCFGPPLRFGPIRTRSFPSIPGSTRGATVSSIPKNVLSAFNTSPKLRPFTIVSEIVPSPSSKPKCCKILTESASPLSFNGQMTTSLFFRIVLSSPDSCPFKSRGVRPGRVPWSKYRSVPISSELFSGQPRCPACESRNCA